MTTTYSVIVDSHVSLRSYLKSENQAQRRWNSAMKAVRISIEWNYMVTASHFRYVGNKLKLKILQSDTISRIYIVATILRNFFICLYGSQSSKYFNYIFDNDFLDRYINQSI